MYVPYSLLNFGVPAISPGISSCSWAIFLASAGEF